MLKRVIVGTAGHIDHGKTSLVRSLTGVNTDRLAEEQRRGITIELGFAHRQLPNGIELGFVDVPGHERFVRNMLAGAAGIDIVLLVVAADESVMPQTREHFEICRLLGVQSGLIVLTKSDLVDPDILELVRLEVEEFVAGSFLENAPVLPVSTKTGEGVDSLLSAIEFAATQAEAKSTKRYLRLPIDRVFTMKGFGTVVTGTLLSGTIAADTPVALHPGGEPVRVRGLQVHSESVNKAAAGQRTAVNLAAVSREDVERGMVLTEPGRFEPTTRFDCRLELLSDAPALKHGASVHVYAGTAEAAGRVLYLDRRRQLEPNSRTEAQVRLREPLLLAPGDRFIVRQPSPVITIGGGLVVDNLAPKHRAGDDWESRFAALASGDAAQILDAIAQTLPHGSSVEPFIIRTGWRAEDLHSALNQAITAGTLVRLVNKPGWWIHRTALDTLRQRLSAALDAFHEANALEPGITKELLRSRHLADMPAAVADALLEWLADQGVATIDGDIVRRQGHQVSLGADETQARDDILRAFSHAALTVPALREFLPTLPIDASRAQALLQKLLREGELVRVTPELVFHSDAIGLLRQRLAEFKQTQGPDLSVPDFKNLAGISRKYAIPLLEYLDRKHITRRVGDKRQVV